MTGWRVAHLPALLVVAAGLLVAAGVVGGLLQGTAGAAGAVTGAGVVVAGYLLATLVIAWADAARPGLVLPLGLASYLLKLGVVTALLFLAAGRDWAGLIPMAGGVIAAAAVWPAAHVWWVMRHRPGFRTEPDPPAG